MATFKREKTKYAGVFFIVGKNQSGRDEKIYYIRYQKNGRQIEEKAGYQTKDNMTPAKAAQLRAKKIEGAVLSNVEKRQAEVSAKKAEENKYTIDRLFNLYCELNTQRKDKKNDNSRYTQYIKPHFGDKEPHEIYPLDVRRVRNKLMQEKSPQTVRHVLALLRRVINFGVKNQVCSGLAFQMDMPSVDNEKTEYLSADQLTSLLNAISKDKHPQAGTIMKVALYTGMRRTEMFRLKKEHIDFERNFILLVDPKSGKDQKIPLNSTAKDLIQRYLNKNKNKSPYVFPGKKGGQRTRITKQVARIRDNAGLPADFRPLHGLRHAYASMLASSGKVDMYHLQKLLTHSEPKMTQRYAHLRDESLKNASDLTGSIIRESVKESAIKKKKENKKAKVVKLKG